MGAYVDVDELLHVALYGVLFGAGIVSCYALAIVGGSRLADVRQRGDGSVVAPVLLAALSLAVVAAALAFGLFVMLSK